MTGVKVVEGPEAGGGKPSVAACPEGMRVLNGGFRSAWHETDDVIANAPMADGKGWAAMQLYGRVRARAVCVPADQAPQVAMAPRSEKPGGDSEAHCPAGTKAIAGGWVTHGWTRTNGGLAADAIDINAPTKNGNGWWVSQEYGYVEARALCS
ncbi:MULTISPECIES: hypothetical protein [unclassified Streptomyces]|uniref:hypothetical protein n=1 Tax=unclassified Streptomyces TaxID=2593676 RepID=UPI000F45ED28|nr:hypothetical protein [Streptomyces sp. I6]RNL72697.1 hypothetical protein EBF04_20300 [Streptomyces sp. I6]